MGESTPHRDRRRGLRALTHRGAPRPVLLRFSFALLLLARRCAKELLPALDTAYLDLSTLMTEPARQTLTPSTRSAVRCPPSIDRRLRRDSGHFRSHKFRVSL